MFDQIRLRSEEIEVVNSLTPINSPKRKGRTTYLIPISLSLYASLLPFLFLVI